MGLIALPRFWSNGPADYAEHGTFFRGLRPGRFLGAGRVWAVSSRDQLRADLGAALADAGAGLSVADRLCHACVALLAVDGAAISLMHAGTTAGTLGSSNALSRRLDEFQFTFGEGPCLDAVRLARPVLVADCADPGESRWPMYTGAVVQEGIRGVFALPVAAAGTTLGALDLYSHDPGVLTDRDLAGGLWASELAALPLLDLMTADVDWSAADEGGDGWEQLASLERVEVYQATGMLIDQLGVDPAEALIRLRAHAFAQGLTASEVAWAILDHRISLDDDQSWRRPGGDPGGMS